MQVISINSTVVYIVCMINNLWYFSLVAKSGSFMCLFITSNALKLPHSETTILRLMETQEIWESQFFLHQSEDLGIVNPASQCRMAWVLVDIRLTPLPPISTLTRLSPWIPPTSVHGLRHKNRKSALRVLQQSLGWSKKRWLSSRSRRWTWRTLLRSKGRKEGNGKEAQVASGEDSPTKLGVGENIRTLMQKVRQGEIDGIQLAHKNITLAEAKGLATAMEEIARARKSTVKTIELFGNKIGDDGVEAFSKVIANENSVVEELRSSI